MKRRYKIAILVSAGFVAWIGLTGPDICIFVAGPQPSWLGSDNACGPMVTYEFQKYFGILWYDTEEVDIQDTAKRLKSAGGRQDHLLAAHLENS
ncbi:MAG: hypothetical protein J4F28_07605 [Nitrosopumilaceae archaeon]|nr:hypothetical protein [Nitrosopumilaceae archaeon]